MTRTGRTAPAGNESARPGEPRSQEAPSTQGVEAVRELIGTSLASLTGMVNWFERMQDLNSSAISGWNQALALCARDLDEAKEPEQLMALPAQLVNHQLEQASRLLGKAMQDLHEAQAEWADRWRGQIADQMQRAGRSATDAGGTQGGLQSVSLAAIGQFQEHWLALYRNWIEAMGASVPAQPESSGR